MSATITFNELEGRSHSILADASRAIVSVAKHSTLALRHYNVYRRLHSISNQMEEFLAFLHHEDVIKILEQADPSDAIRAAETMREIPQKISEVLFKIRTTDLGYWRRIYFSDLARLERSKGELQAHVDAFSSADSPLILLTKPDQDRLVASLLNPPEPNDELRRVFGLK